MQNKQIHTYSFPITALLLGMVVGAFCFMQQPANDKGLVQRLLKPASYGLTTAYVVLTLGVNLRLARERKLRQDKRAALFQLGPCNSIDGLSNRK